MGATPKTMLQKRISHNTLFQAEKTSDTIQILRKKLEDE